jgi:hypothetical protein
MWWAVKDWQKDTTKLMNTSHEKRPKIRKEHKNNEVREKRNSDEAMIEIIKSYGLKWFDRGYMLERNISLNSTPKKGKRKVEKEVGNKEFWEQWVAEH